MVTRDEKNNRLAALMLAGQDGDQTAYRSFLEETSHDVRRFLLRRITASDVDDVLQEILVSLHKARHTYDGERPILPWIFAIARFRLADYLRQHYAKKQHMTAEIPENLSEDVTENDGGHEYLDEAVAALPKRQQKILYLMHTEGYTAKEVGGQLGMNESAVKVAAHRAYKVIWKRLGGGDE